jgi:hypothetical protein
LDINVEKRTVRRPQSDCPDIATRKFGIGKHLVCLGNFVQLRRNLWQADNNAVHSASGQPNTLTLRTNWGQIGTS